jgi:predicted permease
MMSVPGERFPNGNAAQGYYQGVLDAIAAVPGVQSVGSIRDLPLRGNGEMIHVSAPERPEPPGEGIAAQVHQISAGYFRAMGTPLKTGRFFEPTDRQGAPFVVVINEELANRLWPGERFEGKQIRIGNGSYPVVGVVGNMRQRGLAEPVDPAMYFHAMQNFRSRMSIVVRTNGEPLNYVERVKQAIWSQYAEQTITRVSTLESELGAAVARPRLLAWLLAGFGIMGLVLGALGIFGVLAYAVNQRRQEIGVRMALGASPRAVLRMVIGQGMTLAAAGVVAGVIGAAMLTRYMQSVLFGIDASDVGTFVQVVVVLVGAALLASWLPARRAVSVSPVAALRVD